METATLILVYIIGTSGMYVRLWERGRSTRRQDNWDRVITLFLSLLWPVAVWPYLLCTRG